VNHLKNYGSFSLFIEEPVSPGYMWGLAICSHVEST